MPSSLSLQLEKSKRVTRTLEIVMRYANGDPVDEIAAEYECTRWTVNRYARLAGLAKRPKGFVADVRAKVIAFYKLKMPVKQIAKKCRCSEGYVSQVAQQEGIGRYDMG